MRNPPIRRPAAFAAACVVVLAASACDTGNKTVRDEGAKTDTATMGGRTDIADTQIAAMIVAANSGDSAAGVLGRSRANSRAVRDFAAMMVADHGSANRTAAPLSSRFGPPADPDDIEDMRNDATRKREDLAGKSGADFDREYIDHEVHMHQGLLEKIDRELMQAADDPELKRLLEATRPVVAAHLARALEIQRALEAAEDGRDTTARARPH